MLHSLRCPFVFYSPFVSLYISQSLSSCLKSLFTSGKTKTEKFFSKIAVTGVAVLNFRLSCQPVIRFFLVLFSKMNTYLKWRFREGKKRQNPGE